MCVCVCAQRAQKRKYTNQTHVLLNCRTSQNSEAIVGVGVLDIGRSVDGHIVSGNGFRVVVLPGGAVVADSLLHLHGGR
mgnify:CR=1 FL=1